MSALGLSRKQIATNLGISPERVSAICSSASGKAFISQIQKEMYFNDPQKMFLRMVPEAAKTVFKIMRDKEEKGSTRISAADVILDRALGKPKQEIQHEGSLIKELFSRLDQEKEQPVIEVKAEQVEEVIDPLDSWAKENL